MAKEPCRFWRRAREELQEELRCWREQSTKWIEERIAAAKTDEERDGIRREQEQAVWHLAE